MSEADEQSSLDSSTHWHSPLSSFVSHSQSIQCTDGPVEGGQSADQGEGSMREVDQGRFVALVWGLGGEQEG